MLLVAAALSLTVVLSLAGVLGKILLIYSRHASDSRSGSARGIGVTGDRLSIETGCGSTEETGESCGQCEVANCSVLHEEFLSSG